LAVAAHKERAPGALHGACTNMDVVTAQLDLTSAQAQAGVFSFHIKHLRP
jgi:hypothetical protein